MNTLHDTGHDMYLPDRRQRVPARRPAVRRLPALKRGATKEEREAWMRARQEMKSHPNAGPRSIKRNPKSIIALLAEKHLEQVELNTPDESGVWAI